MNCLYKTLSMCRTHPHIKQATHIGRNFNNCIEWTHTILTCFFMLFGVIMFATGTAFVRHDLLDNSQFALKNAKNLATALVVCYLILIIIFNLWTGLILYYRDCHSFCIATYGTLLFFVLAVPLMAEGTVILELSRTSDHQI